MGSGSRGLLLVTVSGLVRSHLPWSCALFSVLSAAHRGEVSCPECLCTAQVSKRQEWDAVGSVTCFSALSKLFPFLYLGIVPKEVCPSWERRWCSLQRRSISGMRCRPHPILLRHPVSIISFARKLQPWPILPTNKTWVEFLCQDFRSDAHIHRISMSRNPTNLSHSHT